MLLLRPTMILPPSLLCLYCCSSRLFPSLSGIRYCMLQLHSYSSSLFLSLLIYWRCCWFLVPSSLTVLIAFFASVDVVEFAVFLILHLLLILRFFLLFPFIVYFFFRSCFLLLFVTLLILNILTFYCFYCFLHFPYFLFRPPLSYAQPWHPPNPATANIPSCFCSYLPQASRFCWFCCTLPILALLPPFTSPFSTSPLHPSSRCRRGVWGGLSKASLTDAFVDNLTRGTFTGRERLLVMVVLYVLAADPSCHVFGLWGELNSLLLHERTKDSTPSRNMSKNSVAR